MSNVQKRLEFFDKFIKNHHMSNDGVNINIHCPFCNDTNKNKRKMVIHLEKCFYHCWVCDKKGTNVNYLFSKINKEIARLSVDIFISREKKKSLFDEEIEETLDPVCLPTGFRFFIEDFNLKNPDVRDVFLYSKKRGFNKHKLCMLRAGYSLDSELRRYLIIPSYNKIGDLNFYVSRNIDRSTNDGFKYKNASIPKNKIIFNELNIDWSIPLTIVEGPLDLIKTNDNATCLLGSALTEDMLLFQEIVRNKTKINLALDSDVYYKTIKIAKLLSQYDIDVDILDTRGNEDVGDMSKDKFSNILETSKTYNENDALLAKIRSL
jgi:DNA primase